MRLRHDDGSIGFGTNSFSTKPESFDKAHTGEVSQAAPMGIVTMMAAMRTLVVERLRSIGKFL